MAKFKFRLEPILKVRKFRQDQEARNVARRAGHLGRAEGELGNLNRRIEQHYAQIRAGGLLGRIHVETLVGDRRFLNHLHQLLHSELARVAELRARLDQAKHELAEAKKQTDIMAKLKARAYQRHTTEVRRKETIMLDDIATMKFAWQHQQAL